MEPSYELFDHTADMGIRVRASTLSDLLWPATAGLYSAIGQLAGRGDPAPAVFQLLGTDAAGLLRDYLAELLFLFERRHRLVTAIDAATFTETSIDVRATIQPVDPEHSVFQREVKAITYHELAVRAIPGGYEAAVIVDI